MKNVYLERYANPKKYIDKQPNSDLELIVTIPCFNEPNPIASLECLKNSPVPTQVCVEIIIVINQSERVKKNIADFNLNSYQEISNWIKKNNSANKTFYVIFEEALPYKHAGVGLARKIAMDEAVRRFESINKSDGIIVCFDADSCCDSNYFQAILDFFNKNPKTNGCSIYFEHPLTGDLDNTIYNAIIDYELFLRYYVNALKYANFPYAHQTIGSSMGVRSKAYQKQGGMNRRKAGEDFYFLNRIFPLGHFGEINTTRVIPSPRPSDRVPFGTGKAVNDWQETKSLSTYNIQIFEDLKQFICQIPNLHTSDRVMDEIPESIKTYLESMEFKAILKKLRANASVSDSFVKNFYQWFDGFKVLKYVHYARDEYYKNVPVYTAAKQLATKIDIEVSNSKTNKELLQRYREIDRSSIHS